MRCIQLALLCVQEYPEDRPSICMIVSMIESEVTDLPCPKQPGFTLRISSSQERSSVNGISLTTVTGR